jgi:hypothetical protein
MASEGKMPACVLLHLDGKAKALEHPLASGLVQKGWLVLAPDLRATGEMKPPGDGVRDASDHNSTEHALWVGRPLLGQWVFDVLVLLDWLALQSGLDRRRFAVAGLGQAGVVALCVAGLFDDRVSIAGAVEAPISYVTEEAYGADTRMGLLAPGILRVGDIPQLAALSAPRRLILAGGVTPQGHKRTEKQLREAFAFTSSVYKLHKADDQLTIAEDAQAKDF